MKFAKNVFPEGVEIYENYNGGAVKEVQVMQSNGKWYTVWESSTVQRFQYLRKLTIRFQVSYSLFHVSIVIIQEQDKSSDIEQQPPFGDQDRRRKVKRAIFFYYKERVMLRLIDILKSDKINNISNVCLGYSTLIFDLLLDTL